MNTSFEKVLNDAVENYQRKAEVIHQTAQRGEAASLNDLNAFINANAQVKLATLLKVHIKKGMIVDESDLEAFLKRAKTSALRDRGTTTVAVMSFCDRLLTTLVRK